MLGLSETYPKFVKRYSNLRSLMEKNVKKYMKDVKMRKFPAAKNIYR